MLFVSLRVVLLLWIIGVVVAVPLDIEYNTKLGAKETKAENKERFEKAKNIANAQIAKMQEGLQKYKDGNGKAKALYETSFGKKSKFGEVEETVNALATGTVTARLATYTEFKHGEIASVPWSQARLREDWKAGPVRFSAEFHGEGPNGLNDHGRAGTIIHEAAHQLANAGDKIGRSGRIIRPKTEEDEESEVTGYTSNPNMHKTVAEVNADHEFTHVRDSVENMHHNAESYALFASLCSQPGALDRRDVDLSNRALLRGDYEQLQYLARRNSCKLPLNHPSKKAKTTPETTKSAHDTKTASKAGLKSSGKSHVVSARSRLNKLSKGLKAHRVPKAKGGGHSQAHALPKGRVASTAKRLASSGVPARGAKAKTAFRGKSRVVAHPFKPAKAKKH